MATAMAGRANRDKCSSAAALIRRTGSLKLSGKLQLNRRICVPWTLSLRVGVSAHGLGDVGGNCRTMAVKSNKTKVVTGIKLDFFFKARGALADAQDQNPQFSGFGLKKSVLDQAYHHPEQNRATHDQNQEIKRLNSRNLTIG